MPFESIHGVDYFHTEDGPAGAPVVLFVHGLGCDGHDWSWQLPAVVPSYRAVVVDLAGHGRSGSRAGGYRPLDLAADLAELARARGWERFDAVGHSMGGPVVDLLAALRPDLVRSLVLVDPALELPAPDLVAARRMAARVGGAEGVSVLLGDAPAPAVPSWLDTWRRRRLLGMAPDVAAAAYLGLRQGPWDPERPEEWLEALARRQCPVLALHRDRRLAELEAGTLRHPDSTAEVWEGCGHWFHIERAARFNARLLTWLEERQEGGPPHG